MIANVITKDQVTSSNQTEPKSMTTGVNQQHRWYKGQKKTAQMAHTSEALRLQNARLSHRDPYNTPCQLKILLRITFRLRNQRQ